MSRLFCSYPSPPVCMSLNWIVHTSWSAKRVPFLSAVAQNKPFYFSKTLKGIDTFKNGFQFDFFFHPKEGGRGG